ncbi:hypothetical protein ACQ4PT_011956 [Festuca glaucescens]
MGRRSSGGGFRSTPRRRTPPRKTGRGPCPRSTQQWQPHGRRIVRVQLLRRIDLGRQQQPRPQARRLLRRATHHPSLGSSFSGAAPVSDACDIHNMAFADCIKQNGSDISRCQFYFDMLNQCRRGSSHGGIAASTTFA